MENSIKKASYFTDVQTATTKLVMSGHIYHSLIQFGALDRDMEAGFFESLLAVTRASLDASMEKATLIMFPMGGVLATSDPAGEKTCIPKSIRIARYFGILEGALAARESASNTCFSHSSSSLWCAAYWKPAYGDVGKEAAKAWCHAVAAVLKPHSTGDLRYAAADGNYNNGARMQHEASCVALLVTHGFDRHADPLYKDQAGYSESQFELLGRLKVRCSHECGCDPAQ